jgi:hypothetical protein
MIIIKPNRKPNRPSATTTQPPITTGKRAPKKNRNEQLDLLDNPDEVRVVGSRLMQDMLRPYDGDLDDVSSPLDLSGWPFSWTMHIISECRFGLNSNTVKWIQRNGKYYVDFLEVTNATTAEELLVAYHVLVYLEHLHGVNFKDDDQLLEDIVSLLTIKFGNWLASQSSVESRDMITGKNGHAVKQILCGPMLIAYQIYKVRGAECLPSEPWSPEDGAYYGS